jgi:hypothetical protein
MTVSGVPIEDDWIYADDGAAPAPESSISRTAPSAVSSISVKRITDPQKSTSIVQGSEEELTMEALKQQNMILVRNMARLFLTAKRELTEKNSEIRRLQQLLEQNGVIYDNASSSGAMDENCIGGQQFNQQGGGQRR